MRRPERAAERNRILEFSSKIQYLFEGGREVGLEPDLDNKSIIKNKTNFRENVLKKHFFSLILVY